MEESLRIALIGWGGAIVGLEFVLWFLFHRGVVRICFPSQDKSFPFRFRVFTLSVLRMIPLCHTVFLLLVVFLAYMLLW